MNELKELEAKAAKLAQEIQWEEEWNRLSIVEKTALMVAKKTCCHPSTSGLLGDARILFMQIKKDIEWNQRNLKNNLFPYKEDLAKRIQAKKLELRTPEQVTADEEAEARRLERLRMFQE